MAKRRKAAKVDATGGDQLAPSSPFASLAGLRDELPPGEATVEEPGVPSAASETFASKVVLSRQRKGRGGKTVTVLSGLLLTDRARVEFMRELGQALGTNVRDEGEEVVLAGDQRERAKAWLEDRGAKRVVISG